MESPVPTSPSQNRRTSALLSAVDIESPSVGSRPTEKRLPAICIVICPLVFMIPACWSASRPEPLLGSVRPPVAERSPGPDLCALVAVLVQADNPQDRLASGRVRVTGDLAVAEACGNPPLLPGVAHCRSWSPPSEMPAEVTQASSISPAT